MLYPSSSFGYPYLVGPCDSMGHVDFCNGPLAFHNLARFSGFSMMGLSVDDAHASSTTASVSFSLFFVVRKGSNISPQAPQRVSMSAPQNAD